MLCRKGEYDHVALDYEVCRTCISICGSRSGLWHLGQIGMLLHTQLIMFPPYSSVLAAAMATSVLQGALADRPSPSNAYIDYTTVTGYFLQDEPSTNSTAFDFMTTNVRVLLSLIPPFDQVEGTWLGDVGSSGCLKHPFLVQR